MNDNALIAKGTDRIFEHRKSTLVIGLTGRTGSGCTTVARILNHKAFADIHLPDLPNPPQTHEERKNRIVHHWLGEHWASFRKIHVSHLIALFTIEEKTDGFFDFIKTQLGHANPIAEHEEFFEIASTRAINHRAVLDDLVGSSEQQIRDAFQFYYVELPEIADVIKTKISTYQPGAYTKLFQTIGDNLRRSGRPFDSGNNPDNLFIIPRLIERFIELGRAISKYDKQPLDYFVIDALRHPFEILYLRDRLPHFYAIAITTDEDKRRTRLEEVLNYRRKEIDSLDAKEYPETKSTLKGYDKFVFQKYSSMSGLCRYFRFQRLRG